MPGLERRLRAEVSGGVRFRPLRPRPLRDRRVALSDHAARRGVAAHDRRSRTGDRDLPRREGVSVLPRGGGSSQAGQTVNPFARRSTARSISTRILELDVAGRRCAVEPGIVLDDLNRAAQAARPVVSGRRLDRVARHHRRHDREQFLRRALAALRQHARERHRRSTRCWPTAARRISARWRRTCPICRTNSPLKPLARDLFALGAREADEIAARFPKVQRRVGGYNIDALVPGRNDVNLAHILVGSEGTLAFSTAIELKLSPVLGTPRGRRLPFRQLPRGDGGGAAHRQARADRGRAGRRDHDRAGPRHRHVPPDAGGVRARPAGGAAAGRVRRGGAGRERAAAGAAARADRRSRLRLGQARRALGRRGRRARSEACRPRSPSCAPPASTS